MTRYIDHHTLAIYSVTEACLQLLDTQPDTDAIVEMRDLLESQFDIIDCLLNNRHFGSDGLDVVIQDCNNVLAQVKEMEQS